MRFKNMLGGICFTLMSATSVHAGSGNCPTDSACDAARLSAAMPDYLGKQKPTTQTMVCVYVVAHDRTEVVLVEGINSTNEPVRGALINKWRPQESKWRRWAVDGRFWVREACIPEAQLHQGSNSRASFRDTTWCNGTEYNQPNRHRYFMRAKNNALWSKARRGAENDPVCLLGKEICAQYGL